jgi:hypothetical protein
MRQRRLPPHPSCGHGTHRARNVELPDGTPGLLRVRAEEARTAKNRIHFNLGPTGVERGELDPVDDRVEA